jgi:hypothetical protein
MFSKIVTFIKYINTQSSNKKELIDLYAQLTEIEKLIIEKKHELKKNIPSGHYQNGEFFNKASITTVSPKKININKCFSYLLRKGKMKSFLNSCIIYKSNLIDNGIDINMINSFQEYGTNYKMVVIR